MKTVILDVRAPTESMTDFTRAWKTGKPEKSARISFAAPELLWQVLTAKRWELLKALCGAGPVSNRRIRTAARQEQRAPVMRGRCRQNCARVPICRILHVVASQLERKYGKRQVDRESRRIAAPFGTS